MDAEAEIAKKSRKRKVQTAFSKTKLTSEGGKLRFLPFHAAGSLAATIAKVEKLNNGLDGIVVSVISGKSDKRYKNLIEILKSFGAQVQLIPGVN